MKTKLLELNQISKSFPGVKALTQVQFELKSGEVHILMGENGAGKSTLMKIVDGIYQTDEGEILLNGQKVIIGSPKEAQTLGIAMIHQELNTVLGMTVWENIFLGREEGRYGFYNKKSMCKRTADILLQLGLKIDPNAKMKSLTVAKMQMVEIAKAIVYEAKIIIMDEPTSAISEKEVDALFEMIEMLKKRNVGIIYISHKMNEIFRIADRITVLRDGETVGTYEARELDNDKLIHLMVGRELTSIYPPKDNQRLGEIVLEAENLNSSHFQNCSFHVKKGEILGFAGLMGAGRSELMETIFGMRTSISGTIKRNGKEVRIKDPKDAIRQNMAFVTEDRKHTGLNLKTTVKKDMSIVKLEQFCILKQFIMSKKENVEVEEGIKKLNVKTPSANQMIKNLSGGNQQKVIIARWLMGEVEVLIMDEPTRGIDVGAKYEIYQIITKLAAKGLGIVIVSSEMPEIIGICDRVMVMHEGRITGALARSEMTQEKIMALATGMKGA